jgi:hypothetical protein
MVGQSENCLMPSRMPGSIKTSIPLNFTPEWVSAWLPSPFFPGFADGRAVLESVRAA